MPKGSSVNIPFHLLNMLKGGMGEKKQTKQSVCWLHHMYGREPGFFPFPLL